MELKFGDDEEYEKKPKIPKQSGGLLGDLYRDLYTTDRPETRDSVDKSQEPEDKSKNADRLESASKTLKSVSKKLQKTMEDTVIPAAGSAAKTVGRSASNLGASMKDAISDAVDEHNTGKSRTSGQGSTDKDRETGHKMDLVSELDKLNGKTDGKEGENTMDNPFDLNDQLDSLKNAQNALDEVQKRFGSMYDNNNDRINTILNDVEKDFGQRPVNPLTGQPVTLDGSQPSGQENVPGAQAPAAPNVDLNAATEETSQAEEAKEEEPETDPMEDLEALTGLKDIKHDVKELYDFVKIQKMREEAGMKTVPVSLHLVFSGNPGTGKTTVARILARLYKQIGVLSKGQLVEVDRSGLVAGYVGQTAIKTSQKIQEAMGGVLFVDEAYTLTQNDSGNDFGQEAIDTILKAMEDHRDEFVVIVAGYTELMKEFVNSNPGLKSRFNKFIEFPDYSVDELMVIFKARCDKYQYKLDEGVEDQIKTLLLLKKAEEIENFANAREARNLFEVIVTNQARRVAAMENPTIEDMQLITLDDLKDDGPEDDKSEDEVKVASEEAEETEEAAETEES